MGLTVELVDDEAVTQTVRALDLLTLGGDGAGTVVLAIDALDADGAAIAVEGCKKK
jgi:hypothetical protein